ncbi:MAG: DUF2262 domain-containing protein [Saccharofermentans sp.]|nr:DUF2262 domain-containing protein [Saccharofermentans sp.]
MLKKFESKFENEEKEITVLMRDRCNGASVLDDKWLRPSADFAALYDDETGEVKEESGRLEWLIKRDPDRKGFGYDFEQYGIYKLLVRKSVYSEDTYMLVKVLEEDVQNEKLLEFKKQFSKPVLIETKYGKFELEREYSWFAAEIELGGFTPSVYLETDEEDGNTADGALQAFIRMADGFAEFDKKAKEYAAQELLDLANEWLEDDEREDKPDEITGEMFMDVMEVSEITFSPDGSISLLYHDGGMFWGHVIEISAESDGTFSDANIAG